ncbi:elongation of very long chain fatty acids protein 1-like [Oppia nitens]|uniref:elongation of very long chain fatty acids protein 1-like n=1 Tax=Oppia nitens TaxID=1686743 RepID=UPI0023DA79EA|nr:elongation of very long chain fatty acids protein 1-like [Oppia nitens]
MYSTKCMTDPITLVSPEINISTISAIDNNITTSLSATVDYNNYKLFAKLWDYVFHGYWQREGCLVSADLPLLTDGPLPMLAFMSCYLIFVLRLGPWLMANRPGLQLRTPMLIYNILMVAFNGYFFAKFITLSHYGQAFLDFQFPSRFDTSSRAQDLAWTGYLYWLTKFVDLLDTVFFVLRKRDRQITGLHLYHHTIVPILGWMTMRLMPMVPAFQMFGIFNSLVHTIMYAYYALAAFGPAIQPYLWWKRYITQIQITQFVIFIAYSLILSRLQTGYPSTWFWFGFIQSPLFFYLFTNFYIKSYLKSKCKSKAQ